MVESSWAYSGLIGKNFIHFLLSIMENEFE